MPAPTLDRRSEKTRSALLGAFRDLIQQHHYDDVGVADIAERARISRSTFYAHFTGKDDLLATSIARPFSVLANTIGARHDSSRLVELMEHFWANRSLCRVLLQGPARRKSITVLIRLVEQNLKAEGLGKRGALILPARLAAVQLAEGLLAPVGAWVNGESRCSPEVLAGALRRVGTAALGAMRVAATNKNT
jgi:AcrR family transcriptional regulator